MKILTIFFVSLLILFGIIQESHAGILNDWSSWDKVISSSDPKSSWLYDFVGGQSLYGTSASLITLNKGEYGLGSLRAGYVFTEQIPYGEVEFQIPNLIKAYLPNVVKDYKLSLGSLDLLPSIGGWAGYRAKEEAGEEKFAAGISVGFKFQF